MITWVSRDSWEMLLSELSQAGKIIPCPRTMICNNCGHIKLLSDTLNAGDNVDAQEDNGFTGSFRNILCLDSFVRKLMDIFFLTNGKKHQQTFP